MKDNKPNGPLFSPEFREIVTRLKDKDPELEALAELEEVERGQVDVERETSTDKG